MSETREERQPIVVNFTVSGAYRPPQVESAAAPPAAIARNCSCGSRAGAGAGDACLCGSVAGSGQ
jgi:hypothetical protein